jgi:hypothetical protein
MKTMDLDIIGLEEDDKDTLLRTWEFIKKRKAARIIFDEYIFTKCRNLSLDFLGNAGIWNIKNLFEIQHRQSFLYLAHIEVDLGIRDSHKSGLRGNGVEYRLWCVGDDYPIDDIVIKEKQLTSGFLQKLFSFFPDQRLVDFRNTVLLDNYEIHATDIEQVKCFLTPNLIKQINRVSDFTLMARDSKIFFGINRDYTLNVGISLLNIIEEI